MHILAAGMEEGWSEPEYQNRDELTERVDSLNEQLAPKDIEEMPVGYVVSAVLGLFLAGWMVIRFINKREKAKL